MLVLARRCGETIRVGDGIRITVVAVSGGQIRLGIEAPDHVPVHREEVYDRIAVANVEAMNASLAALDRFTSEVPEERGDTEA